MQPPCQVSLTTNGKDQILNIPPEFVLSSTEVMLHKEGHRLVIEPIPSVSLLKLLTTLQDIPEHFPDIDEGLLPLDDITL
jgi:antitoxin VapB